ncbi:MAG: alpha-amylase, partial [Thermomicrobiales bacterium]|nr:alpha-amylase [Thermomicrobiales bacterium]
MADSAATPAAGGARWWDDAVCYEIFVRSFVDSDGDGIGDFNGLTSRLNYLNDGDPETSRDLGVTCIWLMPVFASTSYHGYDVEDYYAVESDYGTDDDFAHLLEEAHRRGIRVVLDLVINHTSVEHPWFQSALADPTSPYRDWYIFEAIDPGYVGPWGAEAWHRSPVRDEYYYGVFWEGMPDLNYRNPEVTAEVERISSYWLDRGVDGFRLDAIKHLIENGEVQEDTPETHDWLRGYRAFLDRAYPEVLTIGEIFDAGAFALEAYYPDQLHAYFQFEMAGQFLIAAQQGESGSLIYVMKDAIKKEPGQPWATFLTNHDQNRAMSQLNGDVAQAKLAASAMLTMPGLPFIYYGEEIGMTGAKPDPLIRTPMQWRAGSSGGFTTGTPWQPVTSLDPAATVYGQEGDPDSLLRHYRALVQLHAAHPALGHGYFIERDPTDSAVLAFLRGATDETVLVLIKFGDE